MGDPLEALHSHIDRIFSDFSRGIGFPRGFWDDGARLPFGWVGNGTPSLDMHEADGKIMISAELPGVDERDIEISVHEDMLTISGEKKSEFEDREGEAYRSERSYGRFSRTLRLPFQVDADKVEARYDKGVLKLTIEKPAGAMEQAKKIPIRH